MSKELSFCVCLLVIVIGVLCLSSCNNTVDTKENDIEYDVVLVLEHINGKTEKKVLTSCKYGEKVNEPSTYDNYSSIMGNNIVDGLWYCEKEYNQSMYFPREMGNSDLMVYGKVQSCKSVGSLKFANPQSVLEYFSSKTTLKDDYNNPDVDNESSYYELTKYDVGSIIKYMRYYPKNQNIWLRRGYTRGNSMNEVTITDTYTMEILISLSNKTIQCKGLYSRKAYLASFAGGGTVLIGFNISKIAVQNVGKPLLPEFATVKYTSSIIDATNISKMKELWNSDGYECAKHCYSQANALLEFMNRQIVIIS